MSADPHQHTVPHEVDHECCGNCDDCDDCDLCEESEFDDNPWELREVIALFPNTTELEIDWQVSDDGIHDLYPNSSGNHLQHLKRLTIELESDFYGSTYGSLQADETKMLIDHLHMPSLESITIEFNASADGEGYVDDGEAIYEAISGIESPGLKDVTVRVNMPIWVPDEGDGFPQPWVSTLSTSWASRFTDAIH